MLIGGASSASVQLYVNADAGPTTFAVAMFTTLSLIESPRHIAGSGGVTFMLN